MQLSPLSSANLKAFLLHCVDIFTFPIMRCGAVAQNQLRQCILHVLSKKGMSCLG